MRTEAEKSEISFFLDVIKKRRSVRKYKSTEIPWVNINKIIEAVATAPSAGNQQPCKFIITKDPMIIKKLMNACIDASITNYIAKNNPSEVEKYHQLEKRKIYYEGCFSAPVYITVLTDKHSKHASYNHFDGPIAAATLMLAARALGYGTVFYVDTVPDQVTKTVLNIPENFERVCFIPLGIPTEWPEESLTNRVDSIVVNDNF